MESFTRKTVTQFDDTGEYDVGSNSVSIQKTVSQAETGFVVDYELTVEREASIAVRVVDEIPMDERIARFRGDVHYYELSEEDESLELYTDVEPGNVTRITVSFAGRESDIEQFTSTPSVDQIQVLPPGTETEFDYYSPEDEDSPTASAEDLTEGTGVDSALQSIDVNRDQPAIGVVATELNEDALVHTVLRSITHGFAVLIADRGDVDEETLELCEDAGATTVSIPRTVEAQDVRRSLSTAAQTRSLPGIIFQPSPTRRIDFDRSLEQFESERAPFTDVVHERDVRNHSEPESVTVGILSLRNVTSIEDSISTANSFADEVMVVAEERSDGKIEEAAAGGATILGAEHTDTGDGMLRRLFEAASERPGGHLVVVDNVEQFDAETTSRLVDRQRETGAQIVVGSRFVGEARTNLSLFQLLGGLVTSFIENLRMGTIRPSRYVSDPQSGVRAYSHEAIDSISADEGVWDTEDVRAAIYMHAHERGYDIEEVGVSRQCSDTAEK